MSVDGISKPGFAAVLPSGCDTIGPLHGDHVSPAGQYSLEAVPTLGPSGALGETAPTVSVGGSAELQRLDRGELSLDQYLEAKVDQAVHPLQGLPADQLQFIKETLREQLSGDPVLMELVRRTVQTRGE